MDNLEALSEGLRVPVRTWKDECAFSFLTPETSPMGLFLNLTTFQAFSEDFIRSDVERTGNSLYLNIKWNRIQDTNKKPKLEESAVVNKLAIGVEGGFEAASPGKIIKEYSVVVFPDLDEKIPYSSQLPAQLVQVIDAVIAMDDASHEIEVASWSAEEELLFESKFYKELPQLENGIKISPDPKTWRCAESGMTENLWLNLR